MRVLYSLINFAILAAALWFFAGKTVKNMLEGHRRGITDGLENARAGEVRAAETAEALQQLEQEHAPVFRMLEQQRDELMRDWSDDVRQLEQQETAHLREKLDGERLRYQRSMLGRVESALLARVVSETETLLRDVSFASRFRKREAAIVDHILSRIELSPGDTVYLLKHDVLYVTLTSAFPLDPDLVDRVREVVDVILSRVDGKASFWVREDPGLIGGLCLRIGDTIFDGSLANFIYRLKHWEVGGLDPRLTEPEAVLKQFMQRMETLPTEIDEYQVGRVLSVSDGICYMDGLADIMYGELVEFACGEQGMVLDIEDSRIACVVFGAYEKLQEGERARRIGRVLSVPVGDGLLGRVVNAMGQPIDGLGDLHPSGYRPIECAAPAILDRKSVSRPLSTGLIAIDALVPIGKGQRELIIGDRQTGKTSIAVDTILNQKGKDVICIYVAIGQKDSTVAAVRETLRQHDALSYSILVCAAAYDSAPLQYIAPYAGTAIGEHFMHQGRDVLIVYDDLSKHAVAYRELSLLLHRPSGREAYPGDVFYLHSRLLERSAQLAPELGGGSMTALPIIETQAGDISAYIPTNVISITDGQIFLDTDLYHRGMRPAVDVGLSVSRVGGAAQSGAMKQVSGHLRMTLAQYRELQTFSQFSSDLDPATRAALDLGDRMSAILRQRQYAPLPTAQQVLLIFAVSGGFADDVPTGEVGRFSEDRLRWFSHNCPELLQAIDGKMSGELQEALREQLRSFRETWEAGDTP